MATTGKINGTDILLYVDNVAVSHSTSCSLNISGPGTIPVNNKDSSNWIEKLKRKGYEWTMSVEAFYTLDGTLSTQEIYDLFRNNSTVTLKFSTAAASADRFFSGSAVATGANFDAPQEDGVVLGCEFEGLGILEFLAT